MIDYENNGNICVFAPRFMKDSFADVRIFLALQYSFFNTLKGILINLEKTLKKLLSIA